MDAQRRIGTHTAFIKSGLGGTNRPMLQKKNECRAQELLEEWVTGAGWGSWGLGGVCGAGLFASAVPLKEPSVKTIRGYLVTGRLTRHEKLKERCSKVS